MVERNDAFYGPGLDPETKIYRFVSWKYIDSLLKDDELVLVKPSLWEDPYELICQTIQVRVRRQEKEKRLIKEYGYQVFSQSWSASNMADTMLRAYSSINSLPEKEGERFVPCHHCSEAVLIGTTVKKLQQALLSGLREHPDFYQLYMLKVEYLEEGRLLDRAANIAADSPEALSRPENIAQLLSLKRGSFHLEQEVRPVAIFHQGKSMGNVVKLAVNAQLLIDSIELDPRVEFNWGKNKSLYLNSYHNRKSYIEACGYADKLVESGLYGPKPLLDVLIDLDCPNLKMAAHKRGIWESFLHGDD